MLEPRDRAGMIELLKERGYEEVEECGNGYECRCPLDAGMRVALFIKPNGEPSECMMKHQPWEIRTALGLPEPPAHSKTAPPPDGVPFIMGKESPKPILENIIVAISVKEWAGTIAYDELAVRPVILAPTPAHIARSPWNSYPRPWGDSDDAIVAGWLQAKFGLYVKPSQIPDAVRVVSGQHSYHPVQQYLDSLKWDGTKRLEQWLQVYLGADDSKLIRTFGSKFFIGAVARGRRAGTKVDHMLILEGAQGSLKSTALEALMPSPELFTDDLGEALGKDAAERIQGKWLVEVAELDAMSKAETTRIKSFITRQVDHYRPAYGRHPADFPRQCVFAGTTNQDAYLRDETGGRRFWPVRVGAIDVKALTKVRDQLWAEASARHATGETWWIEERELVEEAFEEQRARFDEDVWHERIAKFLIGHDEVTVSEVLDGLKIEPGRQGNAEKKRVAQTLKALDWSRGQVRRGDGSRPRVYRPAHRHTSHTINGDADEN